jgi:hypothetical protein
MAPPERDGPPPADGPPYRPGTALRLEPADLEQPVRALLGAPDAQVLGWRSEPIVYESWSRSSAGLHAVSGTAATRAGERSWSLVLKQVRHHRWQPTGGDLVRQIDDGGEGPADWGYWRREALAVSSGLLDGLPDRFSAPRCLGIVPVAEDRLWLWLEQVEGRSGADWSAGELLDAAEGLGAFHARYLSRPPRAREWFCRPFVEQAALHSRAQLLDAVEQASGGADPVLRRLFPRTAVTAVRRLWQCHQAAAEYLRQLPAALCHRDLTPRNLIAADGRTVALDWGQTGLGPPGEDLATLVLSWAFATGCDAGRAFALGAEAAERHRSGLEAAGRYGDAEEVLVAYRLIAAFHYGLPIGLTAAGLLGGTGRTQRSDRRQRAGDPALRSKVELMTAILDAVQPDLSRFLPR